MWTPSFPLVRLQSGSLLCRDESPFSSSCSTPVSALPGAHTSRKALVERRGVYNRGRKTPVLYSGSLPDYSERVRGPVVVVSTTDSRSDSKRTRGVPGRTPAQSSLQWHVRHSEKPTLREPRASLSTPGRGVFACVGSILLKRSGNVPGALTCLTGSGDPGPDPKSGGARPLPSSN